MKHFGELPNWAEKQMTLRAPSPDLGSIGLCSAHIQELLK